MHVPTDVQDMVYHLAVTQTVYITIVLTIILTELLIERKNGHQYVTESIGE